MSEKKKPRRAKTKAKRPTRPKKAKVAKEAPIEEHKVAEERRIRPKLAAPIPVVMVRHERGKKERQARGYSVSELSSAGLTVNDAKKWEVPLDARRRSILGKNVERLKSWMQPSSKPSTRKVRESKKE